MSDSFSVISDRLKALVRAMWQPIIAFIAGATAIYQFIQIWRGDRDTVTWIVAILGYLVLVIALLHIALSRKESPIESSSNKRRPISRYRHAKIALIGLVILGLSTAFTGWAFYQKLETEKQELRANVVVLVANFSGPDPEKYRVTEKVLSQMRLELREYDDTLIRSLDETITEQQGSETARSLGKDHSADLVLWGWYGVTGSDVLLTVHIENLS